MQCVDLLLCILASSPAIMIRLFFTQVPVYHPAIGLEL